MPSPKFEKGENVYGLWPGSGGLYFKGIIVSVDEEFATYDVKFEEGTVYTLLSKHVKAVDSFKSQEPKATQVRRRGRSSNTSRSRSRSRTPGRRPKDPSPVRKSKDKSPIRNPKDLSPVVKTRRPGRPSKQLLKKKEEEKGEMKEENNMKSVPNEIDEISLSRQQLSIPAKTEVKVEEIQSRRRSARIATKIEALKTEPILTSISESNSNGKSETSIVEKKENSNDDQENDIKIENLLNCKTTLPSLLTAIGFPVLVVSLYLICQNSMCSLQHLNFNWAQFGALYDPVTFLCIWGLYFYIILLSSLPFGEVVNSDRFIVSYRRNALLVITATFIPLIFAKHYFQFQVSLVMHHLPKILLPVIALSFVLGVIVFCYNRRNSPNGFISTFVVGASTDVSMGSLSIKSILNRLTAITLIVINYFLIEADYERNETISPTMLLGASMQIVYALDHLWDEPEILQTTSASRLNLGWSLISTTLLYPFFVSLITLYNISFRTELPIYCLAPIGVLFIEGLFIKVGSNKQKAAFNKNPENPSFANVESLSTSNGQKLLVSGWWGWVRHPNSLGDIVIHWAFALACGFHVALPYLVTVVMTVTLLARIYVDDRLCRSEFGPSWDRYCQRVTSRVIPRLL